MAEIGARNGKKCVICKRPLTGRQSVLCGTTACKTQQARRITKWHRDKQPRIEIQKASVYCTAPTCGEKLTGRQAKFCSHDCGATVTALAAKAERAAARAGIARPRNYKSTSRRAGKRKCAICTILITDAPRLQDKAVTTAVSRDGKDLCIGCASGDGLLNALLTTEQVLFVQSPERTRGRARFK